MPPDEHPAVTEYLNARHEFEAAQSRLTQAQEVLTKTMEAEQRKTYKWSDKGYIYALTYVQTRTPVIDEQGLRKALTAKVYDRYTVKKLDRPSMERAMTMGEIDPVVVSKFVTERLGKPYAKFTVTEDKREK